MAKCPSSRHTQSRTASSARSPVSESGCARRRAPSPKPQTFRRYSSCRASPNSSTPTMDSRFGRETPKTTSRNALQPLSMRVRRISALEKWVNSSTFSTALEPVFQGSRGVCHRQLCCNELTCRTLDFFISPPLQAKADSKNYPPNRSNLLSMNDRAIAMTIQIPQAILHPLIGSDTTQRSGRHLTVEDAQ